MENEIAYRKLFDRLAEPGDEFGEEWIDKFEENIIEEGDVVGSTRGKVIIPGPMPVLPSFIDFEGHTRNFQRLWRR
jgi:hypothetical protein